MRDRIIEALLWAAVLIAIAIAIAAGTRIVAWIVIGETENVWRAALGIVAAAGGGGLAAAAIRHRGEPRGGAPRS